MGYVWEHTYIGLHLYDWIAIILFLAIVAYFVVRAIKLRKTRDELSDELSDLREAASVEDVDKIIPNQL